MLLVPNVDACFIADFDFCVDAFEEFFGPAYDCVFRLIGRIFIEVEEVVVANSVLRILALKHVPYRLKQCACG